jgi:hypothetical protein
VLYPIPFLAWIAATALGQTQDRLCVGDPARRQNSNFNPNWISRPGALVPLIVPKADDWTLLFGWPSWVRLNRLKNSDLN